MNNFEFLSLMTFLIAMEMHRMGMISDDDYKDVLNKNFDVIDNMLKGVQNDH